jgi:Mg2+/Co2+ transporter CorC
MHIRNIMQDIGYDENEDNADDDDFDDFQRRARQLLIDTTRKNLEDNLQKAELNKRDVFIVTGSVISSLVNAKAIKKITPAIDEARLMESILKTAHTRRYYGTQASTSGAI